jgi:transketolase
MLPRRAKAHVFAPFPGCIRYNKVVLMPKSSAELQDIAKRVRREIVQMIGAAKSGHPGGSLSAVELVVELFFNTMKIDPSNPAWADRDRFVLSKGHAAPVLYAVMAEAGYAETPLDKLNTLRKLGSVYQGHPDVRYIRALEASTGSLGQGLSVGLGMALAARLDGRPSRTYVMLGDGEIQEGQIWEAAMAAPFHKLDNLVAIVDYNQLQLDGFVKDILDVAPLADKWRSFGWHTVEIDGHDLAAVRNAYAEAESTKGKPTCVVAHTVKGKGVSYMENNPKFHGNAPTADELKLALQELN